MCVLRFQFSVFPRKTFIDYSVKSRSSLTVFFYKQPVLTCGVNTNNNVVEDLELYVHLVTAHLIICLIKHINFPALGKVKIWIHLDGNTLFKFSSCCFSAF